MRVCILNSTGQLLEAQSNDSADLDVLITNAVNAGYKASDVTAKVVSEAAFQALITPPAQSVPQSVTPRQARLALLEAGLLDNVENTMKGRNRADLITWQYASYFSRTDPLIVNIGTSLGLNDAALDQLFARAHQL